MKRKQSAIDLVVINTHNPQWGFCSIIDNSDNRNAIIEELGKEKVVRHYSPYGMLKDIVVKEGQGIPLIDCPVCKTVDAPVSFKATMTKGDKQIDIYECSVCGKVPNLTKDIKVKYYVEFKQVKGEE